jgi:prophage regulatory protein
MSELPEFFMRRPEVSRTTGLPPSTLYARIKAGDFPRPVKLGPRTVAWRATDVQRWIAARAGQEAA